MKFLIIFRFFIGFLFIVSGGEKVLGAYQNFLFVVQTYEIFPLFFQEVIARLLPWIELFLGVFLVLGLWLKTSLKGTAVLFLGFMIVVLQAMVRGLPITECGCFGELITFPLYVVFIFDSCMFSVSILLLKQIDKVSALSLDRYFEQP